MTGPRFEGNRLVCDCEVHHRNETVTMKPFFKGDALAGNYCPKCGPVPEGFNP